MIQEEEASSLLWFIDIGSKLELKTDHIITIAELVKHINYEDDKNPQLLKQWWQLLGVSSEEAGEEQHRGLSNSFDLIRAYEGKNNMQEIRNYQM